MNGRKCPDGRWRLSRVLATLLAFGFTAVEADELKFAKDRAFDVEHIKLDLHVDLKTKSVRSRATIRGRALRPLVTIRLDAVDFADVKVTIREEPGEPVDAEFENDGEHITIKPRRALRAGEILEVFIEYSVTDPKSGLHFFAPSEEEPDAPYLMWSQGQSIVNRYWVPCLDHPNEMQTTEIVCTVEAPYRAISNGDLVETRDNPDKTRTFHWHQAKPHVSYLMTLVVGKFASKTEQWRDIPVTYYARPKHAAKLEHSFNNTTKMLEFFSERIGVAYPWAKYDQLCCYGFGGGMENTSATTLGERALYDERRKLDDDPDGLIAHELAHQWYGDLLTCRDWAHLWLNEGFASYFEALWDEHHNGAEEFAHNMRGKARGAVDGGREHPVVWRGYTSPDEQFDSRAYPKGAWVLHMIRRRLGDELFWQVMKTYTERFSHQTVETRDLRKTIEAATGRSFERFFHDWTERAGSPDVKVSYEWLPDDGLAKIAVEQTQKGAAFHFPLDLEFGFGEGREPRRFTHELTEKKALFYVPLPKSPKSLRIDPDQAVLMTLVREQPRHLWEAQLVDANPSARMDAVAHFAEAAAAADVALLTRRLREDGFWAVRVEIAEKLAESGSEESRKALLENVATEHPRVRAAVVEALAEFSKEEEVVKVLADIAAKGDPSYRVEAAAIKGLAALDDLEIHADVWKSALKRDSDREIIRVAVLEALGENGGDAEFKTLVAWARPKRPLECRGAAVRGLGKLISREKLDEERTAEALEIIGQAIEAKPRELRRAGMTACGDLGAKARSLVARVEKVTEGATRRMSRFAKETLAKIRAEEQPDDQFEELREKLSNLEKENRGLRDRVQKLEARDTKEAEAKPAKDVASR